MKRKITLLIINILWFLNARWSTILFCRLLRSGGAIIGDVNYISARVWFDGTSYERFEIGDFVTISSNVRLLTHDWSPHTVIRHFLPDFPQERILGQHGRIVIGSNSFIGTGSIIMPNTTIGRGCIVGAGTVVRGTIPDNSVVIGNPCIVICKTNEYLLKKYPELVGQL